jgi:cell division protein FtsQ
VAVIGWGITRSPLLSVHRVRIQGAAHTSLVDVTGAAGLVHHRQMTDLDEAAMVRSLLALPWIRTARVVRQWPTTVAITLTERHPVAISPDVNGWATIDQSGRVLAVTAARPGDVPEIAEVGAPSPAGGPGTVVAAGLMTDLTVAANLVAPLSTEVAGVAVTSDGQVELILVGGAKAWLGPVDDLSAKLTALATVLSKVKVGKGVVDVRVPTAPVLTAPGPGQ